MCGEIIKIQVRGHMDVNIWISEVINIVKKQLKDLSLKVHTTIQTVFVSQKIGQELNVKETKPSIVNQQCVAYGF